jgi:catechol 2,3-dioxygenase-like lactoylglutathione lyase family enzyme
MVHLLLGEMSSSALPIGFTWATMVPELLVSDLNRSLHFWCDLCGFVVAYDRPEDRFAYLDRSGCQIMLEETMAPGRHWTTAPLEQPFGRGINFQITVNDVKPILAALLSAQWPLFLGLEEIWYRAGSSEVGSQQFLVQDPDGYLLRFSQGLGLRPAIKAVFPDRG